MPGPSLRLPPLGTARRSWALYRAFRVEQSDPERFYRLLAADTVDHVSLYADLSAALVLDVGGGPGWYRDAFRSAGARYVGVDPDVGELTSAGPPGPGTVRASGLALPLGDGCVDVCLSSNVAEHVPLPWVMGEEMLRVTRPGGLVVLCYTAWWGPHGGHETSPWHYLGGARAARRYARRHGRPPKNDFGTSLFPVTVAAGLRWARELAATGRAELLAARPRYAPTWADGLVDVPGVRELATWNLELVLRSR